MKRPWDCNDDKIRSKRAAYLRYKSHKTAWRHAHHPHNYGKHRRPSLRQRLSFAFVFVALAAVGLTLLLTTKALFNAQNEFLNYELRNFNSQRV
ncbi:MAG: hypothetical protein R2865_17165 [Deinococcales bacterium]